MVVPDIDPLLLSELAVGAVALYALVTGARRAIDALLGLARRYDVPEVLIGLMIVAIGTTNSSDCHRSRAESAWRSARGTGRIPCFAASSRTPTKREPKKKSAGSSAAMQIDR